MAAHAIVGAYNRTQFEFDVEHFLIPHVGSYAKNERCSVVVLDNCAIHYSDRVFQLIREKGGLVVFLPFEFVRAVGTNVVQIRLQDGQQVSSRVIKHICGTSPIYIRALQDIHNNQET